MKAEMWLCNLYQAYYSLKTKNILQLTIYKGFVEAKQAGCASKFGMICLHFVAGCNLCSKIVKRRAVL